MNNITNANQIRHNMAEKAKKLGFAPLMSLRDDDLLTMTLRVPELPHVVPITIIGKSEEDLAKNLHECVLLYSYQAEYRHKLEELDEAFSMLIQKEPDRLDQAIRDAIEQEFPYAECTGSGYRIVECATYDEMLHNTDIAKIVEHSRPETAFYETVDEYYWEAISNDMDNATRRVLQRLYKGPYEYGLTEEALGEFEEMMKEYLEFVPDYDHFLKQQVNVNIMIDTGDGNYDYSLNAVYPCYAGEKGAIINDKASIVWLAKQQGYRKGDLTAALSDGDIADPKGFLQSLRQELANLPSSMATLTFLVSMTVEDLIALNTAIKLQDRNGHKYDASVRPNCGQIVLGHSVMCGLYDPWNGGGSVLEIELENDVRLPIRFIRSALPDGCDGYAIAGVYGLGGSAWTDALKEQHYLKGVYA